MKNNKIIINGRETGKTTFLLSQIDEYIKQEKNIILLDSATDHEEKSLLRKVANKYSNSIVIDAKETSKIVLSYENINWFIKRFKNYFPFDEIKNNLGKIICFDLSYFLEKGHDIYDETNDKKKYDYYRNLYNYLSEQIVLSLILSEKYKIIENCVVIMDEIEFPKNFYDISLLQNDIEFIASVHPENVFGTFYDSFEKLEFKPYIKKKGSN